MKEKALKLSITLPESQVLRLKRVSKHVPLSNSISKIISNYFNLVDSLPKDEFVETSGEIKEYSGIVKLQVITTPENFLK